MLGGMLAAFPINYQHMNSTSDDSESESELSAYEQYIKYSTPPSDDSESESELSAYEQ